LFKDGDETDKLGISREELLEYCEWLSIYDEETYGILLLALSLYEKGVPIETALYYSLHLDELDEVLRDLKE
jgi:hypothetical protein